MNIRYSKKNLILIIVFVVAITIIISGFGKVHLNPFKLAVNCSTISISAEDENGGVAVDELNQNVYFFNNKHQLVAVTNLHYEGKKINWILNVAVKDGEILITGCSTSNEGTYLESETILAYKHNGDFIREVDSIKYNVNDHVTVPQWAVDLDKYFTNTEGQTQRLSKLNYSTVFLIKNAIYWLSIPVAIVLVLLLFVSLIQRESLKKHKSVIIALACIIITLVYYSANMVNQIIDHNEKMVTTVSGQLELVFNDRAENTLEDIAEVGVESYLADSNNKQKILDTQNKLSQIVNENCFEYNMFSVVYGIDSENDRIYALVDSRGVIQPGRDTTHSMSKYFSEIQEGVPGYVNFGDYGVLSCYHLINNSAGTPIAAVCVSIIKSNITNNIVKLLENLTLNILAIFILLYVVYTLFGSFLKDIKSHKSRSKLDKSGRALDMCGIFMFVFQIANTIDEVILVYVAKSLCVGMPVALEATLVALPLATNGAGRWLGTFFSGPIIRKFGERRTGVMASALGIVVMLCMALAVLKVNIYVLIICKFVQGIILAGFMYVIGDTLPLNAKNEEEKTKAINHSQTAVIGAEIVAALVGGYLSQFVGYQLVYITGAVTCGIMLIVTIMTFGRKGDRAESIADSKPASLKESWTIFLKKPMLIYLVLYLVPFVLIAGYKNYIFPMYTAGAGVSVLLLSNISVYAKAFTFVIDKPLKQASLKMKYTVTMLAPSLIFCVGLIYFLFCPNVLWAVVMYLGIAVVKRISSVGQKLYIANVSEDYGLDAKLVQSNYYTIESGAYVLQSPVLSAFISIGTYIGSALVGGVCGVMFALFAFFVKPDKH